MLRLEGFDVCSAVAANIDELVNISAVCLLHYSQ